MQTRWGDRTARRSDIVRAGLMLLEEQGLEALQMREVARRAGIALGTVYTYFPTKESLYSAMYTHRLTGFLSDVRAELDATNDFETIFVAVASRYRDMYVEFGRDLDILSLTRDESPVDEELLTAAGDVWAALRDVVEAAGARDPDLSLAALWSTITGLANQFTTVRHELHRFTWDETVRYTARLMARGLADERRV
ncbi:TetR/AcrR family transcriptional regulator [Mycobacterium manitobense]|uniref:TetR/AcrR family transcriptional regulator n=1 Tax=[Mycobacterium] manitobense TaxID=190147 RepID=A0A9X2YLC6_9MYCO|nr:TetR/AcrR family transcriptional regulator [[Mycobacterium] manitobense]MCV7170038.1 TetR/AcrR family transcriptional regulator [[Mycobacterium] manitobense]